MFVKQIVIQGFKSYRNQTIIEDFSPHHNVIIGRNGSGKSNLFAAFRFVLSDAYTRMSREERQSLLYESSGTVISAYVEIVFDNSDNRLPTGNKEVSIRRTISAAKDEYFVDGKSTTKTEVMNLLESAGFSKSNPYYIVPQGRITSLTNAKDEERLQVLKEIAGAQVYEERRKDAMKIIRDTDLKTEKINESLTFIAQRLNELEEEKEELKEYQSLSKEKRCLDFSILDRELQEVNENLDMLLSLRERDIDQTDEAVGNFNDLEELAKTTEQEISLLKQRAELLKLESLSVHQDLEEKIRQEAQLELKYSELRDTTGRAGLAEEKRKKHTQQLSQRIENATKELASLEPELASLTDEEAQARKQVRDMESLQNILRLKRSQISRFKTREEKQKWFESQIIQLDNQLSDQRSLNRETTKEIADLNQQLIDLRSEISSKRSELQNATDAHQDIVRQITSAENERDKIVDERKTLWREESRMDFMVDKAKDSTRDAERHIAEIVGRDLSAGLLAVQEIVEKKQIPGVYGPLCDLFEAESMYKLAIEVTAGTSLLHIVVDTDETASRLMEELYEAGTGRATFIPLNRISSSTIRYPEASDALPLITKLKFDAKFTPAIQQVFGKALVCMDLEIGHQYAKSHKLTAVTLQGDRVGTKGVITGGFHDSRKSKIDSMRLLKTVRDEVREVNTKLTTTRQQIGIKDQEVNLALSNIQKLILEKQKLAELITDINSHVLISLRKQESRLVELLDSKNLTLSELDSAESDLQAQLDLYKKELEAPFVSELSQTDLDELDHVSRELPQVRSELQNLSDRRLELEYQISSLRTDLNENLLAQRDRLSFKDVQLEEISLEEDPLRIYNKQLKRLQSEIEKLQRKSAVAEGDLENISKEQATKSELLTSLIQRQSESTERVEEQQKNAEKSLAKRLLLTNRRNELNGKIRELGVLPEDAYSRYQDMRSRDILIRSQEISEKLKNFAHVNKRAAEQFELFTRQRDEFIERQKELTEAKISIEELIKTLDERKGTNLTRTFKQVAKAFSEIFTRLVPSGTGTLVMQTNPESSTDEITADNFTGVSMKVSFSDEGTDQLRLEQLSGGQKSLCALALIFAIQQSDPAPFYLFDEIDANLDTQHRVSVARMIKDISQETDAQFICTTFCPEMIVVADKFYGVLYQNKMSTLATIGQEDALSFVSTEI